MESTTADSRDARPHLDARHPRRTRRRLRVCHECDWLVALPPLRAGEKADCPRCGHTLAQRRSHPAERNLALSLAALVALAIAVSFPFISFEFSGIHNRIELFETTTQLIGFHQPVVAVCVLLGIAVLPALYLASVAWLHVGLLRREPLPFSRGIARSLVHMHPWMMADVFIVGTLVSLIKVAGLAEVSLGISFWAFCAFAVLLLVTTQSIDNDWMWFSLAGEPLAPAHSRTGTTAAEQGLAGCPTCGLVNTLDTHGHGRCRRCGEPLHARVPNSLQRTWALLAASAVMYVPANLYPIMTTTYLGDASPSTIIGGVVQLWQMGSYPVAGVIFVASVLVPVGKLLALSWLCIAARYRTGEHRTVRTRLYRVTELIGRWSMVDVFVVAILVALIRAGTLMSITPGPAALAFAAVVVLTMLAAITFDPRLLWQSPSSVKEASHA
ncbi:paraquat-inducible protein A [Modicisalibacter coralii]|uniref:PqiA/YebS family transporter subunit n=1 Tax=Modicisalibacter coralii TaxID=2304602 RepID=UPI00100C2B5E